MKLRSVYHGVPRGTGHPAGAARGSFGAPASTKIALLWMMATAALGWLALTLLVPYGGVTFAVLVPLIVLVPALILWTGARAGEKAGLPLLAMVFLIVLLSDVSVRGRALTDTGLDLQSALKFILWASGWLLIFWRLSEYKEVARTWAGGAALAFALWCLFSTIYSPTPVYTFGTSVGMLGMWFVAAFVTRRVDRGTLILTCSLALTVGMVISLALYFGLRERAMAPTEGGTIFRLAGIFSAPNTLGRAAALLLLLLLAGFYYVRRPLVWWPVALVGAGTALACLLLSGSRASALALICAGVVVLLRKRPVLLTVVSALFVSVSAIVLSFPTYMQELMLMVSRTGRLSEVATLTGRTYIWEWVMSAAAERPLHGYGFASTRVVMVEGYRGPWGFTTSSAHNAWLQAWITVGLVGVAMLVINHLKLVGDFFRRPDRLRDGLFVFVIALGLFEAAFAGPSVNLITFTWLLASTLPYVAEGKTSKTPWLTVAPARHLAKA